MVVLSLFEKKSLYDPFKCLLDCKEKHPNLSGVIIGVIFQVCAMTRSVRKNEQEPSFLVEIMTNKLRDYFPDNLKHQYFNLIQEILENHLTQIEKDKVDKMNLKFKIMDICVTNLCWLLPFHQKQMKQF